QKNWIVGYKIEDGSKILIIDDVFTTGGTKYEAIDLLDSVADNLRYIGLIIAVDREEVGEDGKSAIKQFEEKTGIPVDSIVSISEIINYLWDAKKITASDKQRLEEYLKKYGIEEVKRRLI
ncbi:MAG: orotate phosphoribosyltransferase, partial [Methanomicrobia archaeon]|nr:orotate phosphoribosyltransferase [Methanomicrobia archaeon]